MESTDANKAKSWRITAKDRTHIDFASESEKEWQGPFYFVQGADCQIGFIQRELKNDPSPIWDEDNELSELAVARLNRLKPKPKFLLSAATSVMLLQPQMREDQERDFKNIYSKLDPDIPLVCVCGNHDVGNNPTVETVDRYKSNFGDDYFSFWAGGVFFIAINSQFFFNPDLVPELVSEQDKWLDRQLQIARTSKQPAVMFQHIPWFLTNPDSNKNNYFEINHDLRKQMMDKFIESGVRYVFCGHYHQNAGGMYKNLEVVITSAIGGTLGDGESGMRVVKVSSDKIQHEFYSSKDFPENIEI